jgi:hypothetical protein
MARDRSRPRDEQLPRAVPGVTGEGIADDEPRGELGPRLATPPVETPGPSVPAPVLPESDTERAEWADSREPDPESLPAGDRADPRVAQEESAAGAEAAAIGGPAIHDAGDPAMDPLYQAGEGDQEGFEAAERDLIENATHGDGHGNPLRDALAPEAESDRSSAEYGDPDNLPSSEVVDDPETGPDDPGEGPGLSQERWS